MGTLLQFPITRTNTEEKPAAPVQIQGAVCLPLARPGRLLAKGAGAVCDWCERTYSVYMGRALGGKCQCGKTMRFL